MVTGFLAVKSHRSGWIGTSLGKGTGFRYFEPQIGLWNKSSRFARLLMGEEMLLNREFVLKNWNKMEFHVHFSQTSPTRFEIHAKNWIYIEQLLIVSSWLFEGVVDKVYVPQKWRDSVPSIASYHLEECHGFLRVEGCSDINRHDKLCRPRRRPIVRSKQNGMNVYRW